MSPHLSMIEPLETRQFLSATPCAAYVTTASAPPTLSANFTPAAKTSSKGTGKVHFNDFHIVRKIDVSSPTL